MIQNFSAKQVKRQQGFTMIELIMVIVILGVLSAFALPRFADLGTDARKAALQGAVGSIRSSMGIARAAAFAKSIPMGSADQTVSLDGVTIELDFGYPAATAASDVVVANGIVAAAGFVDQTQAAATDQGSYTNGDFVITGDTATDTVTFTLGGLATCTITYTGAPNDSTAPVITVVDTCT